MVSMSAAMISIEMRRLLPFAHFSCSLIGNWIMSHAIHFGMTRATICARRKALGRLLNNLNRSNGKLRPTHHSRQLDKCVSLFGSDCRQELWISLQCASSTLLWISCMASDWITSRGASLAMIDEDKWIGLWIDVIVIGILVGTNVSACSSLPVAVSRRQPA